MKKIDKIAILAESITVDELAKITGYLRRVPESLIGSTVAVDSDSVDFFRVVDREELEQRGITAHPAPEEWGLSWKNFLLNETPDTLLIAVMEDHHGHVAGAVWYDAVTVKLFPDLGYGGDTEETLCLRIWHELLHYHGLAEADDLEENILDFMSWWEAKLLFPVLWDTAWGRLWYERRYYEHLTGKLIESGTI